MVRLPTSATQSDIQQAQRLISKNKEFAARGDPKMQRIIQFIQQTNYQVALAKIQKQQKAGVVEVGGQKFSVAPELQKDFIAQQQRIQTQTDIRKPNIAYKDISGRITQQSIDPNIARQKGLTPVSVDSSGREIVGRVATIDRPEITPPPKQNKSIINRIKSAGERVDIWLEKQRIPESERTALSPAGIKKASDYLAEQTLKAGYFVGDVAEKALQKGGVDTSSSFFFDPEKNPIKRETAKGIISTFYLFSGFSPLMSTGTAQQQQSEFVYDYKTRRFVRKADVVDYLRGAKVDVTGKKVIIKDLTFSDKASRINDLLSRATTNTQRTEIMKIAQQSYGKSFVKEFVTQETGVVSRAVVLGSADDVFFSGTSGVQLKNLPIVETATRGILQSSKVGETSWISDSRMDTKTKQDTKADTKQDQRPIQLLSFKPAQDFKTDQLQKPAQDTAQTQLQKPAQDTAQTQIQTPKQIQKQILRQVPRQTTPQLRPPRFRPTPKKPTTKGKPFYFPTPSFSKRILKKVEESPQIFKVFGRRFGEDISLGSFGTQQKAEQKLKSFLKTTLGRSGGIKKDGEALEFGELGSFGGEFRPAKRDKRRVVQRKEFSLGTKMETSEISYFRKKAGKKKNAFGFL